MNYIENDLLNPIKELVYVRQTSDTPPRYELIIGEKKLTDAKLNGTNKISVMVVDLNDWYAELFSMVKI